MHLFADKIDYKKAGEKLEIQSLEVMVEQYQYKLYKYCFQMVRCKETAEDITQEVFIKYYQLSQGKKTYKPSYLYAIAHSKCIDFLRKKKREQYNHNHYCEQVHEPSPEELVMRGTYNAHIDSVLNCLSSYEKSVLLLKTVYEFNYKEIGLILHKKEATIRKQFNRIIYP